MYAGPRISQNGGETLYDFTVGRLPHLNASVQRELASTIKKMLPTFRYEHNPCVVSLSHGCASGQVSTDCSFRGRIFAHSEQPFMTFSTSVQAPGHQGFSFTMFIVSWTPGYVS